MTTPKIVETKEILKERKMTEKAHPKFKNMFMHLMDETPDIVEKITEKQIVEETIKKQKREERITKATKKGIPKGAQKIEKLYQKTDKDNRMQMENIRIEKQKKENDIKKQENEDKNKIKSQAELSKFKVPKLSKNLTIEIPIGRTKKRRTQAVASFKRIMGKIMLAEKLTPKRKEKFEEFKTKKLPGMLKEDDTILDYLNHLIKFLKGKDILTYYTPCDPRKNKGPLLNRELSDKWQPPETVAQKDRLREESKTMAEKLYILNLKRKHG